MTTMRATADSCVDELAAATRALLRALEKIENDRPCRASLELLAQALCGCMRQTALLAAFVGVLRRMADNAHETGLPFDAGRFTVAAGEVALDLESMRSLLGRATLVAAPALADLWREADRPDLTTR